MGAFQKRKSVMQFRRLGGGRRVRKQCAVWVLCLTLAAGETALAQSRIFVNAGAGGLNNGTSWANAFQDLSDALDQASLTASALNPVELWIARGVYTPGRGSGDQTATFTVVDGVQLFGGFTGGETDLSQRDAESNETILSGNLGHNDAIFGCDPSSNCCYEHYTLGCDDPTCQAIVCERNPFCCPPPTPGYWWWDSLCWITAIRFCCDVGERRTCDNARVVVTANNTGPETIFDGLVITGAQKVGANGIGLRCNDCAPTIHHCTFRENDGYGMRSDLNANAHLTDCLFEANTTTGLGLFGGNPSIDRCRFKKNQEGFSGGYGDARLTDCVFQSNSGAISYREGNPVVVRCAYFDNVVIGGFSDGAPRLTDCRFEGNTGHLYFSDGSGAVTNSVFLGNRNRVLSIYPGSASVTNCVFARNTTSGGVITVEGATLFLRNSTVYDNEDVLSGGSSGAIHLNDGHANIANSILWGNRAQAISIEAAQLNVRYGASGSFNLKNNCIEGWSGTLGGVANFAANPQFVDPLGADNSSGTSDDDLRLTAASPCLDVGDDASLPKDAADLDGDGDTTEPLPLDFDLLPRIQGAAVDLGPYEGPRQSVIVDADPLLVPEAGTATLHVSLDMDPKGAVVVSVGLPPQVTGFSVTHGGVLMYDSNNYGIPQAVTVASVEDDDFANDQAALLFSTSGGAIGHCLLKQTENDAVPPCLHVDARAVGLNTGSDWDHALVDLQAALAIARERPGVSEIWVAEGTYYPTTDQADVTAAFDLMSGIAVYGGFAGYETALDERDPWSHPTVLSGDLLGDDLHPAFRNMDENSWHVVTTNSADETCILDGFTITGGNARGRAQSQSYGGGLLNIDGNPTIRNCLFQRNRAEFGGGGAANMIGSGMTFERCRFIENSANASGGGAFWNPDGNTQFSDCLFNGNESIGASGGAAVLGGESTIVNSTFAHNRAHTGHHGGLIIESLLPASIVNCIFWGNTAPNGTVEEAQLLILSDPPSSVVSHSLVQGWSGRFGGSGNSGLDPRFVDADGADNVPGNADDDLRLLHDSPAVNAGDPAFPIPMGAVDLNGQARVQSCAVDIGAFEDVVPFLFGDYDCSGRVNAIDINGWSHCQTDPGIVAPDAKCTAYDGDADLDVDLMDFARFQRSLTPRVYVAVPLED